jgi:decaprenylphospho-beta-D-ribofuranose 2-oxidase
VIRVHGWGRYPQIMARLIQPGSPAQFVKSMAGAPLIARGLGRSYGDSSLAPLMLSTRSLDNMNSFDPVAGLLTCEAGASLDEILRIFVPRGWFLPVVPGTRFVSVGGAVASDVHGKNHHLHGSFTAHVQHIELLLGNGETVRASRADNPDLFHATCGGMGLTGVILCVSLRLQRIASADVLEITRRCSGLDELLEMLAAHESSPYSVAWVDGLASGAKLGRSLLMLGQHAMDGPLALTPGRARSVPLNMPGRLLNRTGAWTFNALYWSRAGEAGVARRKSFEQFFFPLDAIAHWNRLYGAAGFVQYQFVVPKATGAAALREILVRVASSGCPAFLAVLKAFGAANCNLLSFPIEGYTLALDFKAEGAVFSLLDELDAIVLHHGGRSYLAKDARMSEATFKRAYPRWQEFEAVRARWHAHGRFASRQSRRLGLL